jgi:hypothetical protein
MNAPPKDANRLELARALDPVELLIPPAGVTAFLLIVSSNAVSTVATLCAYLMIQVAWASYLLWLKGGRSGLPVFAIMGTIYWIYFALPLFTGSRILMSTRAISIPEEAVTQAMEMALVGVLCLFIGMRLPFKASGASRLPDIDERASSSWVYIRVVLVLGTLMGAFPSANYLLGGDARQIMTVLGNAVPGVAYGLLLRRYWIGRASPIDRPLLIVMAAAQVANALASGWLGPMVSLGLTIAALFIVVNRRIPWTPIVLTILSIMFLQVGKQEFRSVYWGVDTPATSAFERINFWVNSSLSQWSESLQLGGTSRPGQLIERTTERASLLTQVAHVRELTPSLIPFQEGQTYSYLFITLIPRFIWPDKPSVNDANRFYQVAYGLSDVRAVQTTSISVGCLAEAYINFGWWGLIVVMCGLGALFRVYEVFVADRSNTLILVLAATMLPSFLGIEGQLGVYVGGLLQQMLLTFLVFLPITSRKSMPVLSPNRLQTSAVRVRG